jgi:hypothetical protein
MTLAHALGSARVWRRRCFVSGLLFALLALAPLANASPPDPLWIAGIYDAADFDDVIVAITWLESRLGNNIDIAPKLAPALHVVVATYSGMSGTTLRGVRARAPPSWFLSNAL